MKPDTAQIDREKESKCYHCGERIRTSVVYYDQKKFCCDGCKLVYDLLKDNNLCTYYNLNSAPGISPGPVLRSRYEYLDNKAIEAKLIRFRDGDQANVIFYVPAIHCSSCIWLLENLHKLNTRIFKSSVDFLKKEVTVIFDPALVKLSDIAALLAHTGYEPLISLESLEKKPKTGGYSTVIRIGLAGFCFGNIMMLSFPEYFSLGDFSGQENLKPFLGYLNLFLALPVFFYSASGFFASAWKSIRYRYLNIDAPIALAILVTFLRSVYEILSQTGAGYLDSMTGIVFFMLIGRYFQDRTYKTLSFERDYRSYFPVGVTLKHNNGKQSSVPATDLKKGDRIIVRNNELLPADAMLIDRATHVDYSFITGESSPVIKVPGELIYAGGRQVDGAVELEVVNPTSRSYLTELWNRKDEHKIPGRSTFVDIVNKYFTIAVLLIAAGSFAFWMFTEPSKAVNAMTAVLIVACPCGLLLTSSFVNGNILRLFGRNRFYLKNADVIEKLSDIDTIVFDKTGTITNGTTIDFSGVGLSREELRCVASLAAYSSHPLSRRIADTYSQGPGDEVTDFQEVPGQGIRGKVCGMELEFGSLNFVGGVGRNENPLFTRSFVKINGEIAGYFTFRNRYRWGLAGLVKRLAGKYSLRLVSGDNSADRATLRDLFGVNADLSFDNRPEDKEKYVKDLQQDGKRVMMIGDGLNDAGALLQSDVGIAVSDDTNNFSPACDAILDGSSFSRLSDFLRFASAGKKVIFATFLFSLIYNIIGLAFAVQGTLSPVVAAILMPSSSISIVLIATVSTNVIAWRRGL